MCARHLTYLAGNGAGGRERSQAVLEHHAQLTAAQGTQLARGHVHQTAPLVQDVATRDGARRPQKPHSRPDQRALPASRLTYDAQDASGTKRGAHVLHGEKTAVRDVGVFECEQRDTHVHSAPRPLCHV